VSRPGRVVWLCGRFLPEARARIAATSPAVLPATGLFETIRLVGGAAPLLERHLARARGAATRLGLAVPDLDWDAVIRELARRNRLGAARVRLAFAPDFALVTCEPLPRGLGREQREGIDLTTTRSAWSPADLKATARVAITLAERQAGGEALRVSGGRALETTRSNFFAFAGRGLETAAPPRVLPGVARDLVLEAARTLGVKVRARAPRLAERARWRGAFVTNALRGVRPVRLLDGAPLRVGDPTTRALQRALDRAMGLG
jgi:branched-subunit amino acid aminotransferase/4-amino-4-deoxychorismate lyase